MKFATTMFAQLLVAATFAAFTGLLGQSALASEGGPPLDRFPAEKLSDQNALQSGAKLFVNYCLNCHSASLMRYNRLTDIGLTEEQIKKNLLFTGQKVGDMMDVSIRPSDATAWFGAAPPDLSVTARARASEEGSGPDWLYTYMRSFYRDAGRDTGWNNAVFDSVAMPHVLWELQGMRGATIEDIKAVKDGKGAVTGMTKTLITYDAAGLRSETTEKIDAKGAHEGRRILLGEATGGKLTKAEYDDAVGDLVAFMAYLADPSAKSRLRIGAWVLLFLSVLAILTWNLNRSFWKDIR